MHLLIIIVICVGLWLLFPVGFKYLVGVGIGFCFGGFWWCLLSILGYIPSGCFLCFVLAGIVGGCVLAAKG